MGVLRLLLAFSVIAGHSTPILGLQLLPADFAVRCFFIISGFYMQLILAGKYDPVRDVGVFYLNRWLRLYPVYLLVLLASWAWVVIFYATHHGALPQQRWVTGYQDLSWPTKAVPIVANASLVGLDVLANMTYSKETGIAFQVGSQGSPKPPLRWGGELCSISPAWSVSLEIWFYLLVPILARARTWVLLVIGAASFALSTVLQSVAMVDTQRVFPAQLWFFVVGMLLYRGRLLWLAYLPHQRARYALLAQYLVCVLAGIALHWRYGEWFMLINLAIIIPITFHLTKSHRLDRLAGNLSYSLYLVHWPICFFVRATMGTATGVVVGGLSLVAAAALYYFVEHPIDRLRQAKVKAATV